MIENKRINNPWIKIVKCIATPKMKTSTESLQKQTMGLIFNVQNPQFLAIIPYRKKKSFRYTAKISL